MVIVEHRMVTEEFDGGFADDQAVTMDKTVDLSERVKPKADLSSFDYESFMRR